MYVSSRETDVTLEASWSFVKRYATVNNSKYVTCFAHCQKVLSCPCFHLTGFACLFGFLFQSPCHTGLQSFSWVNKVLLFFYTQYDSSSLLLTSRVSLSDREKSTKQPRTTMTKLYSNNASWAARSRCVLESVLDVFMLAWVMSSIAAAERNQLAVLFFI